MLGNYLELHAVTRVSPCVQHGLHSVPLISERVVEKRAPKNGGRNFHTLRSSGAIGRFRPHDYRIGAVR